MSFSTASASGDQPPHVPQGLLARLRAGRALFSDLSSFLVVLYDRALRRLRSWPLPFRRRVTAIHLANQDAPIYIRLGTTDFAVVSELFHAAEYAPAVRAHGHDAARIVDLGSNIGISLRFWRAAYPTAALVGIEPDADNFALCVRNNQSRSGPPTQVVRACVGLSRRSVTLDRSGDEWGIKMNAGGAAGAPPSEQVDVITFTDLLERTKSDGPIDILKCDIEGAEAELFSDGAPWLEKVRTLVIETHEPYNVDRLMADLAKGGHRFSRPLTIRRDKALHVMVLTREDRA